VIKIKSLKKQVTAMEKRKKTLSAKKPVKKKTVKKKAVKKAAKKVARNIMKLPAVVKQMNEFRKNTKNTKLTGYLNHLNFINNSLGQISSRKFSI